GEASPRLLVRGRGRGAASSFRAGTRAKRRLVFSSGDESAASSSRTGTKQCCLIFPHRDEEALFRVRPLEDETSPPLPAWGRGDASSYSSGTRHRLVFLRGDEATPLRFSHEPRLSAASLALSRNHHWALLTLTPQPPSSLAAAALTVLPLPSSFPPLLPQQLHALCRCLPLLPHLSLATACCRSRFQPAFFTAACHCSICCPLPWLPLPLSATAVPPLLFITAGHPCHLPLQPLQPTAVTSFSQLPAAVGRTHPHGHHFFLAFPFPPYSSPTAGATRRWPLPATLPRCLLCFACIRASVVVAAAPICRLQPHPAGAHPCFSHTVAATPASTAVAPSSTTAAPILSSSSSAHSRRCRRPPSISPPHSLPPLPTVVCYLLLSRCRSPRRTIAALFLSPLPAAAFTTPFALLTLPACRSSAAQPPLPSLLPHLPSLLPPCFLLPLLVVAAFLFNRSLTCHVVASLSPVVALTVANHLCPPLADADNLVAVKFYYIYDICL
ncbi:hypothetical protein B296_00055790, partial [Ensete ventricosum]